MKTKNISQLKKDLWKHFSLYIRRRDKFTCFTCGKKGEGQGMHAGHFISKAAGGLALYFNEKNVNAQCYHCNINLGGNQWEYGKKLGDETVKELYRLKNESWKWGVENYLEKISYYKEYNENNQ